MAIRKKTTKYTNILYSTAEGVGVDLENRCRRQQQTFVALALALTAGSFDM